MDRDNTNNFYGMPPFNYDVNFDNNMNDNPMFNPIAQYEQAYMYYRYMTQAVENNLLNLLNNKGRSFSNDNMSCFNYITV